MKLTVAIAVLAALFLSPVPGHAGGRAEPLALVDCTLIDGTGRAPIPNAVVLIDGGVIQAAGSAEAVGSTKGYTPVSLRGAWLLPGFINAHVHSLYSEESMRRWLAAGVTTVRDVGYTDDPGYLRRRDAFNANPACARVVSSSPMITHVGGYGTTFIEGPAAAREMVRKWAGRGVDLIKTSIEDDLQGRTWPPMTAEEIKALVSEAHAAKKRVSVHISHVRNLAPAVDAGADDIAHMVVEPLSKEQARAVVAKGIVWVPTLELWKGVSEKHALDWDKVAISNTSVFFKAGGKIALGTDFNGYTIPFDQGFPITEAKLLLQAGLSPMDVIVAGTRNAAEVCGRASDLGTIEKGKIADLLAVKGDPLKDITALQDVAQVFKAGKPVPR